MITLTNHQNIEKNKVIEALKNKKVATLQGLAGTGKALAHGSKIPTPTGYTYIENIEVGDMVFTHKGTVTKVIGVYPQGEVQLYRIVFDDNRIVKCCGDHLWTLYHHNKLVTVSTKAILHSFSEYSLPPIQPIEYYNADMHHNPFFAGMLLGVAAGDMDSVGAPIFPSTLLFTTLHARKEILRGIMAEKEHIITNNVNFALNFRYMANSVGLSVNYDFDYDANTFKLYKPTPYSHMGIKSITAIDKGEATCIMVADEDHIFLTDNFIPTHNTTILPYLVSDLSIQPHQVLFTAFTGTAVLNMRQENACTLHSLLYKPILRFGKVVGFKPKAEEDLADDLASIRLIIADEFSMIPDDMLTALEHICRRFGILLLLVGDYFQLGNVSGSPNKYLQTFDGKLTEVLRQALDSPLLWAAHEVRQGIFVKPGEYGNLFVGSKQQLNPEWLRPDIQFVVGLNNTREKINLEITKGRSTPQVGDKIMFLRNDFDAGVSNGTQGIITNLNNVFGKMSLEVQTDRGDVELKAIWQKEPTPADRKRGYKTFATHAYAITTHKAQGATIANNGVIIDESYAFGRDSAEMVARWTYVALTRFTSDSRVAWLR